VGASAGSVGADDGGIPEDELALAPWRPVVVNHQRLHRSQVLREIAGVGDGGACEDEDRVRPVVPADSPQAAQHAADVGAKHAAIDVQLVEHHKFEPAEEASPGRVPRQNAHMQHVHVREDQAAAIAQIAAVLPGGVAVIGRREQARRQAELFEFAKLVLRERFGGEEIERVGGGLLHEAFEHGEVVAEGLAAGCGGDDNNALAIADGIERPGLVRVEAGDSDPPQAFGERR